MMIPLRRHPVAQLLLPTLILLSLNACSIMVGNIKPVEEKSQTYGVMDLSKINSEWIKLSTEEGDTEISDVAYQAKKTASIISLNSACRGVNSANEGGEKDLKSMTQVLFMGLTDLNIRSQKDIVIQSRPALESTVEGKLHGEVMVLRSVVFRHNSCVYDLIYLAKPAHFEQNEQDFAHFIASLRLK